MTPHHPPLCASGCNKWLSPIAAFFGWREQCAGAILGDVRLLQDLTPEKLGFLVAFLRENGRDRLASAVIGCIPFGDRS